MSLNRSLSNPGIPEPDCVCISWKLELNLNIFVHVFMSQMYEPHMYVHITYMYCHTLYMLP